MIHLLSDVIVLPRYLNLCGCFDVVQLIYKLHSGTVFFVDTIDVSVSLLFSDSPLYSLFAATISSCSCRSFFTAYYQNRVVSVSHVIDVMSSNLHHMFFGNGSHSILALERKQVLGGWGGRKDGGHILTLYCNTD